MLPVIMISSKGTKDNVMAFLEMGADDFIVKPSSKNIILKKVKKVICKYSDFPQ